MSFESLGSLDFSGAFKVANLGVAALTFIIGIYLVAFGAGIGLLEFRVPAEAYPYASFLFSFIGRGISQLMDLTTNITASAFTNLVYTFIGASINGASVFRIIAGLLVFLVGLAYIALEAVPSISPPDNMNPEGIAVGINDEDVI